ncbi:MAG: tRNA (adenosine(37)-N6)-threonylcarbamoyltransferase complex ATPase subunit type 1 TsaE [Patescibacteria group bacterium]
MARFVSHRPHETRQFAKRILAALLRERRGAVVLALAGELGTGKTTFIQGLASSLGIRGHVQSPTFVLVRTHPIPKQFHQFHHIYHFVHIDAYRLDSLAEARRLGLKDILKDRDAIVVIEWADRIRTLIPRGAIWLRFTHGKRSLERVIKGSNFQ